MVIRSRDERPVEVYLCPQEDTTIQEEAPPSNPMNMPMPDLGNMSNELATFDNLDTPVRMIPHEDVRSA